jgi:hypothetical protein
VLSGTATSCRFGRRGRRRWRRGRLWWIAVAGVGLGTGTLHRSIYKVNMFTIIKMYENNVVQVRMLVRIMGLIHLPNLLVL